MLDMNILQEVLMHLILIQTSVQPQMTQEIQEAEIMIHMIHILIKDQDQIQNQVIHSISHLIPTKVILTHPVILALNHSAILDLIHSAILDLIHIVALIHPVILKYHITVDTVKLIKMHQAVQVDKLSNNYSKKMNITVSTKNYPIIIIP